MSGVLDSAFLLFLLMAMLLLWILLLLLFPASLRAIICQADWRINEIFASFENRLVFYADLLFQFLTRFN